MEHSSSLPESGMAPSFMLRPFERSDFETLKRWAKSPEFLLQWTGRTFAWPLDDAQLEAYLAGAASDPPQRYPYMALDADDGRSLGHIGLREINRLDGGAIVSCVLVSEEAGRGRGLGTSMMERISEIAFEQLGLHRLELHVFDFNRQAIACYKRAGFRIEGLLREKRKIGDAYWSLYLMSLLAAEWKAQRRTGTRDAPNKGTPASG